MSFVSFAQNFEDVLLHRVFGGQETGFYVDVGAYHPIIGSVTKALYDRGWSGINIEPGSIFEELAAARPRDINLRMAVTDFAGEVAFIEDAADRGMSHIAANGNCDASARMVPCDTLEAIVRIHAGARPVDLVKVDAEGAEAAIVRSTNWRALRPRVLVLEATLPWSSILANQDWEPVLLEQGYFRAYFDGINCFYLPEEERPALQPRFQVPVNALDRAIGYECEEIRAALAARAGERNALQAALQERQAEAARLTADRETLRTALQERQAEATRLTIETETLRTALQERQAEAARLTGDRETLRTALQERQRDVVRLEAAQRDREAAAMQLVAERDALRQQVDGLAHVVQEFQARHEQAPPEPGPPGSGSGKKARSLARRTALLGYKLVRPIARPVAWRLRGFMTGGVAEQMRLMEEAIRTLAARSVPQVSYRPDSVPAVPRDAAPQAVECTAAVEMRALVAEMERALLTLALERDRQPLDAAVAEPRGIMTTAGGDRAGCDASPDPGSSSPPGPSGTDMRLGSLEDLDALNAEYADRPVRDRVHAVSQFLLRVDGTPLDDAGDPFGRQYYDRVVDLWASISNRADYDPRRDELAPYVDPAASLSSPSFYAFGDSRFAGEFLAGIGFILQQLDLKKGDSLLEYGPGEGQIALHLARLGCQVSVIDVEQRYLDSIMLQAKAIGAEISVRQGLFGDGFDDGRRFDCILFFEAFHHALDHARVLWQLHDRLRPGGRVVFASEAVILPDGPWTHTLPYPWGPRLDGLSVNAMRIHGWCELGFREDYFVELLLRSGYLCTVHPCPATALGTCYIARPHGGRVDMGTEFLIRVTGGDAGWHAPENGQRWTRAHALLPLDARAAADGIVVEFCNSLPIERTIMVRLSDSEHAVRFAPDEQRTVQFDVPADTRWLEILSPTDCLAPYVGEDDQRVVGIAVRAIVYPGVAADSE